MTQAQIVTLEQLAATLEGEARLLGLDLGTKTIGLALSDLSRTVATPLETIARTKFTNDIQYSSWTLAAIWRQGHVWT